MGESTIAAPARRSLGARTMTEAFRLTVEDHPDRVAVRTKDDEVSLTWAQLRDRVDALAGGLAGLGVRRGDTVALMMGNRPEFHVADLAVMTLGATPFSIYPTFTPAQIAYVVGDAGAKLAIVEAAFLETFRAARAELPALETLIVIEGAEGGDVVAWADVEGADPDFDPIFEKLKAGLEGHLSSQGDETRGWIAAARRKVELEQAGEPVPDDVAATAAAGEEQLFGGLRSMLGLDEAIAVNVGAAPTPRDVLVFFHAIGIPLGELWGMSETSGIGAVNPPDRVRIGTVGPPSLGVEMRLADDGELLVRGEVVMPGYRNQPEKTAEALDADGWMHTGDIAAFDSEGYVKIVDRKKEIVINAAGKNMSPANIESTLKGAGPIIGQVAVIGDAKPFNTALVVLDSDFAPAFAAQQGLEGRSLEDLADEQAVQAAVQEAVDRGNAELSRVEQIKKFTILPGDWLPGGDELTPTMKLKRKPIAEKYAGEIEAMYQR